jgi:hypothetical protein
MGERGNVFWKPVYSAIGKRVITAMAALSIFAVPVYNYFWKPTKVI